MIPISDNLKNALSGDTLAFQNLDITVELRDDRVITLDNDDIYQGSFSIDRSVASGGKIEIGSAIASECSVKLVNDEGQFNSYNFLGAVMTVEVVINNERVPLGVFTVDEVKKEIGAISLIALDKMVEFDKFIPVDMAQLPNPLTPKTLINWSCAQCGVALGGSVDDLPNINYVIKGINDRIDLVYEEIVYEEDEEGNVTETDPEPSQVYVSDLSQITFRNLLQYAGQLTGTCCFIGHEGKLRFSWFTQTSETLTTDNRFSSDIDENAITITGVNIKQNNVTYSSGSDGYVLEITDNKLISIREDNVQTIVDNIGNAINGFTYYPFSASILPLIYLMPLDKLSYIDADGNSYPIIITGTNYVVNSAIAVEGVGETQVQHWYADNSGMTNQISTETKNAIRDLKDYLESYIGNFNKVVVGNVRATAIEAINQSADGKDAKDILTKWCYNNDTTYIDGGNIYTGTINANAVNVQDLSAFNATIGGFSVGASQLWSQNKNNPTASDPSTRYAVVLSKYGSPNTKGIGVYKVEWDSANNTAKASWPFSVDYTGKMIAEDAEIEGKIITSEGTVGGFNIGNTNIHNGMTSLSDTTHNGVYLGTDGIALGKGAFKVSNDGNISIQLTSNAFTSTINSSGLHFVDNINGESTGTIVLGITKTNAPASSLYIESSSYNVGNSIAYSTLMANQWTMNATKSSNSSDIGFRMFDADSSPELYMHDAQGNEILYIGSESAQINAPVLVKSNIEATGNIYGNSIYENGTALSSKYFPFSGGTLTGNLKLSSTGQKFLYMDNTSGNENHIGLWTGTAKNGQMCFVVGSGKSDANSYNNTRMRLGDTYLRPNSSKGLDLGQSSYPFNNVYGTTIYENGTSLSSKYQKNLTIKQYTATTSSTVAQNGTASLTASACSSKNLGIVEMRVYAGTSADPTTAVQNVMIGNHYISGSNIPTAHVYNHGSARYIKVTFSVLEYE